MGCVAIRFSVLQHFANIFMHPPSEKEEFMEIAIFVFVIELGRRKGLK